MMGAVAIGAVAVVVGSGVWWREDCAGPREVCADPQRALRYADDDAWRAAWLLQPLVADDRLRVLTEPDDETRHLSFPGEAPGPPTAEALVASVAALRKGDTTGRDVIVYLAAHGSPDEVHLGDGRHTFRDLRARIDEVLAPDDRLLLVADACYSGTWRGGVADLRVDSREPLLFPAVDASPRGILEAVVRSQTPEDDEIRGGVFSYLVLSGLIGGADADGDGRVVAQELSDFVHAYVSGARAPFVPTIRAPAGASDAVLPGSDGPRLTLGGARSARWIVIHPDGVVLAEAFTHAGEDRSLLLPAGTYTVWQLPVIEVDGEYVLGGDEAFRHTVTVDGTTRLGAGERVAVPPAGVRYRADDEVSALLRAVPVTTVRPPPSSFARYHAAPRGLLAVGPAVEVGPLRGVGRTQGAALTWSTGRGRSVRPRVEGVATVGGTADLRASQLGLGVGAEVDLVHGRLSSLSGTGGLGWEAWRLTPEGAEAQGTIGAVGRAGLAWTIWPRHTGLSARIEVAWAPGVHLVERHPDLGLRQVPGLGPESADLDRAIARATLQWRL